MVMIRGKVAQWEVRACLGDEGGGALSLRQRSGGRDGFYRQGHERGGAGGRAVAGKVAAVAVDGDLGTGTTRTGSSETFQPSTTPE